MSVERVDLIIPLADRVSRFGDAELRYCLRSFAKYGRGLGNVIIVSWERRDWWRGIVYGAEKDERADCKDANIIKKVLLGIGFVETRKVAWCCDDCALLRPVNLYEMPRIHNDRGESWFASVPSERRTKWQRRMLRTFSEVRKLRNEWGCRQTDFDRNFDAHTPQVYDAGELEDALEDALDRTGGDVCINTWAGLWAGWDAYDSPEQESVKTTMEGRGKPPPAPKVFLGYNDAGFSGGAAEYLMRLFPEPCEFEAEGEGWKGEPLT